MPSGIIVADLIRSSLRLIGAIATGETPSAEEASDGLLVLNDLLDNWSTEPLSVWGSSNQTFSLVPGKAVYTIGPTGDFNTTRPISIDAAYCTFGGVDFPMQVVGQIQYNGIRLKGMGMPLVERLMYVNEDPLGVITVWPVPTDTVPMTLTMGRVLSGNVALGDTLSGPPGFLKAVRYNLAVEMAPEFGVEASPTVMAIAADAKGDYKRANIPAMVSGYDTALVSTSPVSYLMG